MEDKKVYKIGLLPWILLILDIVLIIVVIIMGIVIKNLKDEKEKNNKSNQKVVENTFETGTTPISAQNENNTVSNSENNYYKETNNGVSIIHNSTQKPDSSTSNKNGSSTTNTTDSSFGEQYTSKIVENRGYVYDAQYTPNGIKADNYSTNDGTEYNISDIVLPYVNMNSDDAKDINSEIEILYNKCVEEFKVCSQNENSFIKSDYETFITSNIYSILITIQRGEEENSENEYIAYNFDVISGTKLDYNQVCYIAGITNASDSIRECIDNLEDFESYYLVVDRNNSQADVTIRKTEILENKEEIYTNYQQDLLNNEIVYFLDNNLKLNISLKIVLPDSEESYRKIVTV